MPGDDITGTDKLVAVYMSANGATWQAVLDKLQTTQLTFWRAMMKDRKWADEFAAARNAGMHVKADELEDIDQTITDNVTRMRAELKSKNLQWLLARRLPKLYGDNLTINVQERPNARKVLEDIDRSLALTGSVIPAIAVEVTSESEEDRRRRLLIESML